MTRWTGAGAPFLLLFLSVVVSSFLWGARPGLLAGIMATPIAILLTYDQAIYTRAQALAQGILFLIEISVIAAVADRFSKAKSRAERNELALRKALDERLIFSALIEYSSDFVGIADKSGVLTYVNPAGRKMIGLAPDFPIEKTQIPEYYPPEQRAFAKEVILKSIMETGYWKGETSFRHWQTERPIPVSDTHFMIRDPETKRLIGRATITRDISEIKRVENELRTRETELKEAQRVAHVGSWVRDAKGDVLFWSEELYRIYGRDPNVSVVGFSGLPKIYTPESMARLAPALNEILKNGTPYAMDLEVVRPDGSTRWVSTRAEAVRDAAGRIVGFRGILQDITELKQLQRMRDEWTSVIAHDLRQPIGVIKMCVGLLQRTHACGGNEKAQISCTRINAAASTLSRMVNDLLDVSQLEAHRLSLDQKWVDPALIVHETVDRLAHLTRGFRVNIVEENELFPIFADPVRIEQVLGNLVSNAAKYGDKGSEILVQLEQRADHLEISITNHGAGISTEELPRIFNLFSRSVMARGAGVPGLGLGLYISKGLVEAHGGRIWVESTPGKTTSFRFTLPCRLIPSLKVA
ncbi:MAG: ATP-binding protein [Oligoflexia bacterium]|nr:ATP-binding protein [Oligoflexia bacterium]